jgi:hypothetical protein
MRRNGTVWVVITVAVVLSTACGKSPTEPSGTGGGNSRTVASVAVAGNVAVSQGGTSQLTATAHYSDQTTETVTSQATWTSSNPAVATVSATGLLTAVTTGTADITATFQSMAGRRTATISAARYLLELDLGGFTALDTCDDFTQGLSQGEFATSFVAVRADGSTDTISQTTGYPGSPSNLSYHSLGRNETFTSTASDRTYTVSAEPGQFIRVQFRSTEWDSQIVIIPPSTRDVPDGDMNDRSLSRTHSFSNGAWTGLGPNTLVLGSGGCSIRANYTITATRQ